MDRVKLKPWSDGDAVEPETLRHMQARVAREAIGSSTLRKSTAGTMAAVIRQLCRFDLAAFSDTAKRDFDVAHAVAVRKLQNSLRRAGLSDEFGRCAKAINIFLRGAVCHHHIRGAYGLGPLEPKLHLPLDSLTMDRLRSKAEPGSLPKTTITGLTPGQYRDFQAFARRMAGRAGVPPIFLDDAYWAIRDA